MAKRKLTASGFGSPEVLSNRILESIQQSAAALESGTITEKEFGNRVRSAMRLATGLPENARRKLQLDAQSARLTAKDSVKLRTSARSPRVQQVPVDLASFNPAGQEPLQKRLKALVGEQFVPKAFGGEALPNVTDPRIAAALEGGNKPAAQKAVKGQQRAGGLRRIGGIGAGGALGALILSKLFAGKQNDGIDPAVQLQLAQQLGGGGGKGQGVNTSRTLSDVGRLLTIIKTLQGIGGLAGPASQEPRLI